MSERDTAAVTPALASLLRLRRLSEVEREREREKSPLPLRGADLGTDVATFANATEMEAALIGENRAVGAWVACCCCS